MTSIAIPIQTWVSNGEHFAAIPDHTGICVSAPRPDTLRKRARQVVLSTLEQSHRVQKHPQRLMIGTPDAILLIEYQGEAFEYRIAGTGRSSAGATLGFNTFAEAETAARQHATDSYGGVLWTTSL